MTEKEWLECNDPRKILDFLRDKASERKLRLFACACVRRRWSMFEDNRSDRAIEATERYADSRIRKYRWRRVMQGWQDEASPLIQNLFNLDGFLSARAISVLEIESARMPHAYWSGGEAKERRNQADSLRDIFGPLPFRPVTADPTWLDWNDSTIPKLVQVIYDDRAFDRLPILADALEDAGCDNQEILAHCREPIEHVRGCWLLDLLLGKS